VDQDQDLGAVVEVEIAGEMAVELDIVSGLERD